MIAHLSLRVFKTRSFSVPLRDLFSTGLRLESSQQGQAMSLGNLSLAFFIGFLNSLGQKFSIFYSLLLIFFQCVNICVARHVSNKKLNLGCFGPGLLTLLT